MNDSKKLLHGRCHITSDWSFWDYTIHCDDSQIARQGRALTYPFTFDINESTQSAQFSSTSDLPYYDTTLFSCTCADFVERKLPCKHIYRLAKELGIIDILKRPTFDKDKLDNLQNSSDIDNEPDQIKRQKSSMEAKCKPIEINYEEKTALFSGSGKFPYIATTSTCTCRDYLVRKLPCKHIYRLRHELNNHE